MLILSLGIAIGMGLVIWFILVMRQGDTAGCLIFFGTLISGLASLFIYLMAEISSVF